MSRNDGYCPAANHAPRQTVGGAVLELCVNASLAQLHRISIRGSHPSATYSSQLPVRGVLGRLHGLPLDLMAWRSMLPVAEPQMPSCGMSGCA